MLVNGGVNRSALDGWWAEAYQEDVGWALEGDGHDDESDAKVTPVVDKTYPLSEAAEAIRYLENGRARGKVVISITR